MTDSVSKIDKISKRNRFIAAFTLISIINQIIFPSVAMALTGGPNATDFSGFSSASNTGLINDATGGFNYSIPVVEIDGYTMALSYNSSKTPDGESSWVGDWSLSPGNLSRNKVGYADDFNNIEIERHNKKRASHTSSVGLKGVPEIFSVKMPFSASVSLRHNNYTGFSFVKGASAKFLKGLATLDFSQTGGESQWSVKVNPVTLFMNNPKRIEKKIEKLNDEKLKAEETILDGVECDKAVKDIAGKVKFYNDGGYSKYMNISAPAGHAYQTSGFSDYYGIDLAFKIGVETNLPLVPIETGANTFLSGNYTRTDPISKNIDNAFGYLYSAKALKSKDKMDYYVDNDFPFDKRNSFIGTPIASADVYNVSGDGISGSFRAYQKYSGQFRPQFQTSEIISVNAGADANLGTSLLGMGTNLGGGASILKIGKWDIDDGTDVNFYDGTEDEPYFFRFAGDKGGTMTYDDGDDIKKATVVGGGIPGGKVYKPHFTNRKMRLNNGKRVGRSSNISYRLNSEMLTSEYGLAQEDVNNDFIDRQEAALKYQIGEFEVTNSSGVRYSYSLPVYARNEKHLTYDADDAGFTSFKFTKNIYDEKNGKNDKDVETKIGEVSRTPYATSYLITEIKSPDYAPNSSIASKNSFGNSIKFGYDRIHGSRIKEGSGDWYRWRQPYTGFLYNKGEISTPMDDVGTVSYGEKEIYYLKDIKSKNKIIKFVTEDRFDGIESADYYDAANSYQAIGDKRLKRLKEINEYLIDESGNETLLKTTHFEYYDYDKGICQGVPNFKNDSNPNDKHGKLTLRKVWVEHRGIKSTRISPYVFEHEYMKKSDYPNHIQNKYPEITAHGDQYTSASQNPVYDDASTGPWGYYRKNGNNRISDMQSWVDQNVDAYTPPNNKFDPGAWLLKRIKLPTGGEIQVQYEQADYNYVQDKLGHIMVSLDDNTSQDDRSSGIFEDMKKTFSLNLAKEGITDLGEINEIVATINRLYKGGKRKMYFKFLYRLVGDGERGTNSQDHDPAISECNAEYIEGFVPIDDAEWDSVSETVKIHLSESESCSAGLPGSICKDYVRTQKNGNVDLYGPCGDPNQTSIDYTTTGKSVMMGLWDWFGVHASSLSGNAYCQTLNEELSYFRIPMNTRPIKGGGVRVKNLLMYDEGLETGDGVLYGTSYDYTEIDKESKMPVSTGVASNLPAGCWEENPLYQMVDREAMKILWNSVSLSGYQCKALYGNDLDQVTGPIARSLLPPPSITYSKVTSHNIHQGETATGYSVKEFRTYKSDPITVKTTKLDQATPDWMYLPLVFVDLKVNNLFMAQGFEIIKPQFNGVPLRDAVYDRDPKDGGNVSALVEYNYFDYKTEKVPLIGYNERVTEGYPGLEEEMIQETKNIGNTSYDLNVQFDVNIGLILPFVVIPSASFFPKLDMDERKLKTHATTTIISYPPIVKSVKTISRDNTSIKEFVAFDEYTGEPLLTRNYDGFDYAVYDKDAGSAPANPHVGAYESFNYMASHHYDQLGPKYLGERRKLISHPGAIEFNLNQTSPGGLIPDASINVNVVNQTCDDLKFISNGDLVRITSDEIDNDGRFLTYDVIGHTNNYIQLHATTSSQEEFSYQNVNIEILKSGRKNQLDIPVGSVTTYGVKSEFKNLKSVLTAEYMESCNPLHDTVYHPRNVIAANASVLSDNWQYSAEEHENMFAHVSGYAPSDYRRGLKGRWRAQKSYVYKDDVVQANSGSERIQKNAGVMHSFSEFNWKDQTNLPANWLKVTETTKYDPSGNALEEKNALGIYSAAMFGYNEQAPILVAQNSDYKSIIFESFEKTYDGPYGNQVFENVLDVQSGVVNSNTAHSGYQSYQVDNGEFVFKTLNMSNQIHNDGYTVKFWLKTDESSHPAKDSFGEFKEYRGIQLRAHDQYGSNYNKTYYPRIVARTGEWTLCEVKLTPSILANYTGYTMKLSLEKSGLLNLDYFIDDLISYPTSSQVSAYVYDVKNMRLMTSFGPQHFGSYNVYNAEGKLTMKKIETEEGMKTIQQTNYNNKTQPRN